MKKHNAFTLVELLVVIGIIAVLIAILLPVLSRVKRLSYRMACASNMRQVGMAFLGYAQDYRGSFPLAAMWHSPQAEDWIHWQSDRDVKQSALWQYLGKSAQVLKCPLGILRPPDRYQYSYGINLKLTGVSDSPETRLHRWPENRCKLNQVIHPSEKVMLVEPNPETIFDGVWSADGNHIPIPPGAPSEDFLSVRHYTDNEDLHVPVQGGLRIGWTHVIAVDGHYMYIQRWKTRTPYYFDPRYDGPPLSPPPGAD
jgi:prepilin-type N-terminal cleavage/methylation domain-containing protein